MNFPMDDIRFFSDRLPPIPVSGYKRAAGDDSDLDTVKELENAIGDLANALDTKPSSGYDTKVRKELLAKSVSQDYDTAKMEWGLHKKWVDPSGGKCELCGHVPIIYHFQIKNKHNHNELVIGSECILNYVIIEGFSKEDLKKYLSRLRARLKDRRFDAIEKEVLDVWDQQDQVFLILKQLVDKAPDLNVLDFYTSLARLQRVRGIQFKDHYSKYIQGVGVLGRVMENTYGASTLKVMPDKIHRKQKLHGKELSDKEKLGLYIEFETQLKFLFKFGTPQEALSMILDDCKAMLREHVDSADEKRTKTIAEVNSRFGDMKRELGNRTRLKDYVDSWCDQVESAVTEKWANYKASLGDLDGILSGKVYVNNAPSTDSATEIQRVTGDFGFWRNRMAGEQKLFNILMSQAKFTYMIDQWALPAEHPLKKVLSIPPDDLKATLFTCFDRGEVPLSMLDSLYGWSGTYQIQAKQVAQYSKFMERILADSPEARKYIDEAAKAEEAAKRKLDEAEADRLQKEREVKEADDKAKQEFQDLLEDADEHKDPNKPYEDAFITDLRTSPRGNKYHTIKDLSPRQLSWLKAIAGRRDIPQQAPPDAAAAMAQANAPVMAPDPSGVQGPDITLSAFWDALQPNAHGGRETGVVTEFRKRYKTWGQLSPKQQKWMMDIYTRNGNPVPKSIQ